MKRAIAVFALFLMVGSVSVSATPRELYFNAEYLAEILAVEHEYRFNDAAINSRAKLDPPLRVRFSAPGLGRVRAVFTQVRRFSKSKAVWSSVNFQGTLLYQDGAEEPVTMSVRLDELVMFPILDKRGRAIDIRSPFPAGFNPLENFSMKKRRDADWHAGLQDCGRDLEEHSISSILQPQLLAASLKVATMEMEGDSDLVSKESDPTGYIDDVLAAVEAIYERDLSVTFEKEKETIYSTPSADPYSELDGNKLIEEVRTNNLSETVTLTHLITGKDTYFLDSENNRQYGLAGIASVGAVCNSFSNVGYSERAETITTTSITMAHEVGHNFGATHPTDDEGFIMDATGTPSTKSEFSTFSKNEINQFINQRGSCLADVNLNSPTLMVSTDRKTGVYTFDVTFSEDRSACTFAIDLAPNQAFSKNKRSFDGFLGRASTAQVTGNKKRRSKKGVFARATVNCDGSEVSSDPTVIPQIKKIKTKKKKKLAVKKWMRLKNMIQTQ